MQPMQQYGAPQPRPYVRFEMRPVEDRSTVDQPNQVAYVDKIWAIVSAPGSRDTVERLAEDWIDGLRMHAREGRIPSEWPNEYAGALEAWKQTQEQPLVGLSLKLWPGLTPAQLQNCLAVGLRTVEDLATANEQSLQRLGMGSVGLKTAAATWLKEQKSGGALAMEIQTLTNRLTEALGQIDELRAQLPDKKAK